MTQPSEQQQAQNMHAYNLDNATTPGGMKVRWRIRIATGAESQRLDIIQQEAILSLLTWADKHMKTSQKTPEILPGNSPELMAIHAE